MISFQKPLEIGPIWSRKANSVTNVLGCTQSILFEQAEEGCANNVVIAAALQLVCYCRRGLRPVPFQTKPALSQPDPATSLEATSQLVSRPPSSKTGAHVKGGARIPPHDELGDDGLSETDPDHPIGHLGVGIQHHVKLSCIASGRELLVSFRQKK